MTASCSHVAEFLAGDVRGELAPQLAEHLAGCAACRVQLEMHRRLNLLRSAAVPGLSPGFAQRVTRMATAQEQAAPLSRHGLLLEVAYALTCVAALWGLLGNTGFRPPSFHVPGETLPWLVPAGFAAAMGIPGLLRGTKRRLFQLLAS